MSPPRVAVFTVSVNCTEAKKCVKKGYFPKRAILLDFFVASYYTLEHSK